MQNEQAVIPDHIRAACRATPICEEFCWAHSSWACHHISPSFSSAFSTLPHSLLFILFPSPHTHFRSLDNSEVDSEDASVIGNKAAASAAAQSKSKLKGVLSKMQSDNDNEETDQGMSDLLSKYQTKNKGKTRNI